MTDPNAPAPDDKERARLAAERRFGIKIDRPTTPTNDREAGQQAAAKRFGRTDTK